MYGTPFVNPHSENFGLKTSPMPRVDHPAACNRPNTHSRLIESIRPNAHGWLFPSATDPTKSVSHGTLYSFMWRQREREVIPVVTNRNLRRPWKTLAGQAGMSEEIRDRLQNHTLQDVSSKSYDRWNYMPDKRAAMKRGMHSSLRRRAPRLSSRRCTS